METKLIYTKLLSIMKEIGAIGKGRVNESQKYKFRGIDDVMNELHEKFSSHGVFILTDVIDQRHEERQTRSGGLSLYRINTYKFTFVAEDGSSVVSTQIGEGMDSGDKASNKAASVALKYALMFMFLIPTDEPKDPENDGHDLKPNTAANKAAPKTQAPRQKLLTPTIDLWGKVIDGMKAKGKNLDDWRNGIKESYMITDADEKELFKQMDWA